MNGKLIIIYVKTDPLTIFAGEGQIIKEKLESRWLFYC